VVIHRQRLEQQLKCLRPEPIVEPLLWGCFNIMAERAVGRDSEDMRGAVVVEQRVAEVMVVGEVMETTPGTKLILQVVGEEVRIVGMEWWVGRADRADRETTAVVLMAASVPVVEVVVGMTHLVVAAHQDKAARTGK
jgi:hypothetical protein